MRNLAAEETTTEGLDISTLYDLAFAAAAGVLDAGGTGRVPMGFRETGPCVLPMPTRDTRICILGQEVASKTARTCQGALTLVREILPT